jgi:hypothetical protein
MRAVLAFLVAAVVATPEPAVAHPAPAGPVAPAAATCADYSNQAAAQ